MDCILNEVMFSRRLGGLNSLRGNFFMQAWSVFFMMLSWLSQAWSRALTWNAHQENNWHGHLPFPLLLLFIIISFIILLQDYLLGIFRKKAIIHRGLEMSFPHCFIQHLQGSIIHRVESSNSHSHHTNKSVLLCVTQAQQSFQMRIRGFSRLKHLIGVLYLNFHK